MTRATQLVQSAAMLSTVFTTVLFSLASAKMCTDVLSRNEIKEITWKEPCVQKYDARCSFLSLSYCTFYRTMFCDKKQNKTVTTYYVHTACCQGFYRADNGTCIKKQPGVQYNERKTTPHSVTADPKYVELPVKRNKEVQKEAVISGGGYAGIICGLILLLCITAFIVVAVRKKKRRKQQKPDHTQKVVYVGVSRTDMPSVMSGVKVRTPSSSSTPRAATPSSSRTVTPPRSPVKLTAGVSPLLPTVQSEETIPESDV